MDFKCMRSEAEGEEASEGEGGAGGEADVGYGFLVAGDEGLGGKLGFFPFHVEEVLDDGSKGEFADCVRGVDVGYEVAFGGQ